MLYLIPAIPLILLIIAVILRQWRVGVVLIFIWLLAEDVVRRLVPGQPGQIMLIKDALIFLSYFSFFAAFAIKDKKIWRPSFVVPLSLLASFILIDVFNTYAPNLFFGLIGMRSYLWYLPLAFLGYHMFDDKKKLFKFCRILVYAAIPLFIFAVFQYFFYEADFALIKPFATAHEYHSFGWVKEGMVPLLSSVFGTAHRFGRFSMLLFFLGIGLLSIKRGKFLIISTVCAFLGIILSGSRSAFVLTVIGIFLFFLFATYVKKDKIFRLWRSNQVKIFSITLVLLLILPMVFLVRDIGLFHISAFYYAFEERIPWMIQEFGRAFSEAKFFGVGTGTMSQGLEYVPGGAEWIEYQTQEARQGFWFETGVGKILFELGITGLFFFYLFWGYLFHRIKKEINKLGISPLKNLALAISIFSFLILMWFLFIHHQTFGDATTLVVLWFFIGALFSFNKLKAL